MPLTFFTLLKSALNKRFINQASGIKRRIETGLSLGNWFDQDVEGQWIWWWVLGEPWIYHQHDESWSYCRQAYRRYYLVDETDTCPCEDAVTVSVVPVTANCVQTEGYNRESVLLSAVNSPSNFEANSEWSTLPEGFDYASNDQTILLDKFILPEDMCSSLVDSIRSGTASIVSDGSYEANSSIGKAGTSSVILSPSSIICQRNTG